MFTYIWHTFFFDPIYNTLVFFLDIMPHGDVGLAIIATVAIVKIVLFPMSLKAVKTQKIMRELAPKLKEIKDTHKDNREALARATMDAYKEAGMNPFASILVLFVQIPVVFALYFVVAQGSAGIALPAINPDILYWFVSIPSEVSMLFLGSFDITAKSLALAFAAGITQFFSTKLTIPPLPPRDKDAAPDFKDDLMRNMNLQMLYVMPFIIIIVAYTFSAAIALYFVVSNIAAIIQALIVNKHR